MANRWGGWDSEEEGWMSIDEDDDSESDKGSELTSPSLRDASVGRKAGQESSGGKAEVRNYDWLKQEPPKGTVSSASEKKEALVQVKAPELVARLKTAGTAGGERKMLEKPKDVDVPVKPATHEDFDSERRKQFRHQISLFLAERKACETGQWASGGKAEVFGSNNDRLKRGNKQQETEPPKGIASSRKEKEEALVHVKAPELVTGLKTGGNAGGERKVLEKPNDSAKEPVRPSAEVQQKGLEKKKIASDPDTMGAKSLETSRDESFDSFSSTKTIASAQSEPIYKLVMPNDPAAQDGIPISAGLPPMDLFYANRVDISRKVINQARKDSGLQRQPGKLFPDRPVNQQKFKDLWDEMKREWDHMMFMFEHNLLPENQDQVYLWNSFAHSWGGFLLECENHND